MLKTSNILDWETFWTKSSVSLTTRNVAAAETSSMYVFGCLCMCPHISSINRVGKKVLINCSVVQHIFIIIDVGEMQLRGKNFIIRRNPPIKSHFPPVYFTGGLHQSKLEGKMRTKNPTRARRESISPVYRLVVVGFF